jgi:hypothetical protein
MPGPYNPTRQALYHPEAEPPKFKPGPPLAPHVLGVEAARLAYLRAETDPAQRQALKCALAIVGYTDVQYFIAPAAGVYAYAAYDPLRKAALVAFRGTQPQNLRNLLSNIQAVPSWWHGAWVHQGFAQAAQALKGDLDAWFAQVTTPGTHRLLCGHSLGGAMATLLALHWQPEQLVTLGCPRVGDHGVAQGLKGVQMTRLVNCCDKVTRIPPAGIFYRHACPPLYIDRNGALHAAPRAGWQGRDRLQALADYRQYLGRVDTVLLRSLADHAPLNYLRAYAEHFS